MIKGATGFIDRSVRCPRNETATKDRLQNRVGQFVVRLVEPRVVGPLVGAALVALAIFACHSPDHPQPFSPQAGLRPQRCAPRGLGNISSPTTVLTVVSLPAMAFYDVLAAQRVARDRSSAAARGVAALVGYGDGRQYSFHLIVGGAVRYRIYQTVGLDTTNVGRIVGISFLTYVSGIAAVLGLGAAPRPGWPAGARSALRPPAGWSAPPSSRRFRRRRFSGSPPGHAMSLCWAGGTTADGDRAAVAQILVGALDIGTAAAVLYVLLPPDLAAGLRRSSRCCSSPRSRSASSATRRAGSASSRPRS